MSHLKDTANRAAQDALRACHDYVITHDGKRSARLDAAYSAAERVMDAVEQYERLAEAHDGAEDALWAEAVRTGQYVTELPDVPLATPDGIDYVGLIAYLEDPGDHFVGMPR